MQVQVDFCVLEGDIVKVTRLTNAVLSKTSNPGLTIDQARPLNDLSRKVFIVSGLEFRFCDPGCGDFVFSVKSISVAGP